MLVTMQERYAHDNTLDDNFKRYLAARADENKESDRFLVGLLFYVEQLALQINVLQGEIKALKSAPSADAGKPKKIKKR